MDEAAGPFRSYSQQA